MNSENSQVAIDLLIHPKWIIPIEPTGVTLSDHALAVNDGRIVDVLPYDKALERYSSREELDLPGHVLLPGLVNLHTHAAMSLMRGYADDLPLTTWLTERIWPAEARHLTMDFVRTGTLLACAEMLRGGITTFNDMYFFPAAAVDAVRQSGMRAALGLVVLDHPTNYAADADDYLSKGLTLRDACKDHPLLSFCLAPHAPYTVTDKTFEKIATLSAQLELPIHTHLHETPNEIAESIKQYGVRPIQRLHTLGLLGPQFIAVHAVHLEAAEIDQLSHTGCHVALCPTSNLKLGSGIPAISDIHQRGINFGLGTDGAASNNRLDIFQEMRLSALLAKGVSEDAAALTAHQALQAATLNGARALGLDHQIGSLRPGKAADLCAVRIDDWMLQPCFDPASHLVYTAGRDNVTHTWVAGKLQMQENLPSNIDVQQLLAHTNIWHNRLAY
ncbi:N-ethylammeline chlorohydrolase [Rugosibacter aromaticivorans]|uniref:N-ethylammeline chlorohydrolase n=1 Tax=Rugosibacter aromaticivorans TaxID=1565605 RepID=A0A0C5J959_9PROT|nr:TRZ/ATZ family hydrolase [Rugosibacter aromaticivorans]AJP48510.1 N-ethylammeline chlorohydrolase [Rugosibacter aromaticivorans]